MKKLVYIFFLSTLLFACDQSENQIKGGWQIDRVYYNNKEVMYDLITRYIEFKTTKCILPVAEEEQRNTDQAIGIWELNNNNHQLFLNIQTKNQIFNRNFKIVSLTTESPTSNLLKMTLIADSLKIECTKIPYQQQF